MIPKRIHQIWIGDQSKRPSDLMETVREMNPTWEYTLWTEDNLPKLRLQSRIDAMPDSEIAGKADLIRYELLYRYGGFYIDADTVALKPFDDFLLDNDSFACWENEYVIPGWIANGYMATTKGNHLMQAMINRLMERPESEYASIPWGWSANHVGPKFLTDMITELRYSPIMIYPSHYFIPVHYSGNVQPVRSPTYTYQLWGTTYVSDYNYGESYNLPK